MSKPNKDVDDKITLLYLTGNSTYQIEERLGVARKQIRKSLKRTNTPRRGIAEAMQLRRAFST